MRDGVFRLPGSGEVQGRRCVRARLGFLIEVRVRHHESPWRIFFAMTLTTPCGPIMVRLGSYLGIRLIGSECDRRLSEMRLVGAGFKPALLRHTPPVRYSSGSS